VCCNVLQCAAVCCSVLQCAAVCCSVLQCAAVCCSVLQCDAVCYICMIHGAIRGFPQCAATACAAVCCSVLQCAAVCCTAIYMYASWGNPLDTLKSRATHTTHQTHLGPHDTFVHGIHGCAGRAREGIGKVGVLRHHAVGAERVGRVGVAYCSGSCSKRVSCSLSVALGASSVANRLWASECRWL